MIQHKAVAAHGVKVLDEDAGIVEAIVSVTGNVDDGGDIIMPGAYEKTLKERTPKGVHGHSWTTPVARTEEAVELLPGDERLKNLLDNDTWLKFSQNNWGGLYIKGRYNLDTQRGREAFADVKFYGSEAEFSIGYSTGPGDTKKRKDGTREIHNLTLYEWSDVLFGMNPETVAANVKQLQSKAFVVVSDSYEDIRRRIQEATRPWTTATFGANAASYVEATFDDRVIIQVESYTETGGYSSNFYQVPYTFTDDGVEFAEAIEVEIEGVVAPKSAEELKARNLVLAQRTFGLDPDDLVPGEKSEVQPPPVEDPAQSPDAPAKVPGTAIPIEVVPNTPETVSLPEEKVRLDPLLVEFEMLQASA